jgi:hypothetical protein
LDIALKKSQHFLNPIFCFTQLYSIFCHEKSWSGSGFGWEHVLTNLHFSIGHVAMSLLEEKHWKKKSVKLQLKEKPFKIYVVAGNKKRHRSRTQ